VLWRYERVLAGKLGSSCRAAVLALLRLGPALSGANCGLDGMQVLYRGPGGRGLGGMLLAAAQLGDRDGHGRQVGKTCR